MKQKIVVYTALFGNYSGLIEQPKIEGIDYICYTDQDLSSNSWNIIKVSPPVPGDNTRSNRYYKILPHKHLKNYEISVYIDANYLIIRDFRQKLLAKLNNASMLCFDHNQTYLDPRNCAYKEYNELVAIGEHLGNYRDDPRTMKSQIDFFKSENYPQHNGLIFAAVLIRKHHDNDLIELMDMWWSFVQNRSKRDQLSFNYCVWKTNFTKLEYLKGDLRSGNPWFYWFDHKLDFSSEIRQIKSQVAFENKHSKTRVFIRYNLKYILKHLFLIIKIPIWNYKINRSIIAWKKYHFFVKSAFKGKLKKQSIKTLIKNHTT
ncbi:glycosyltransferase domain-containing protein [Flavicella marina]|uniref:glycosyltransferase domain-containing protein n=1 Tax=Flavicella marina TaxID=1475951 RepID=UPI0012650319|nr:glycosyltransferase domain-containing protein [Flavicella marina]